MNAADHMAMARNSLRFARYALDGEFADKARREAYLAGFHAALAYIVARTGKSPKTHSGTRSEFARLSRDEAQIGAEPVSFLGWSYELKSSADYGQNIPISRADAERAIAEADRMLEKLATLLGIE